MLEHYGDFLTIEEYSKEFHCSEWSARDLCRRERIPSVKIGNRILIPKKQLIAHIEASMTGKAL